MRKITNVLLIIVALTAQIMMGEAQAVVLTVSPNDFTMTNPGGAVVTVKGLPAWFQGADGVAIQPCVGDPIKCALAGSPNFFGGPVSYPTNFPAESFYTLADANFVMPGASDVLLIMALEYVFVDVNALNVDPTALFHPGFPAEGLAQGSVFQRLKLVHTFTGGGGSTAALGLPAGGNFTVRTPWGTTIFPLSSAKCVNSGGDTKCTIVRDSPPTAVFAAPDSGIFTFLKDPAAPVGFLGIGGGVATYTGAIPPNLNSVSVTDPLGRTGTNAELSILTGQTVGLDVQPSNNIKLGAVTIQTPAVPSVAQTITITNTTGKPILFPALAAAGANAADFAIASPSIVPVVAPAVALPGCSGATLTGVAPGNACSFDVTFTPLAGPTAARSATIPVAPTTVQPVPAVTPPLPAPPAVTISLSGTAQHSLTVAVATTDTSTGPAGPNDGNGTLTSTPAGISCSNVGASAPPTPTTTAIPVVCSGAFDVGAVVTLTPTATASPLSLFDGFTGLCTGTPCTVTMDGPKGTPAVVGPPAVAGIPAVTVSFVESHLITTSATPAAGGTITATQPVKHGSTPTIVITPTNTAAAIYRIVNVTDTASPVTLTPVAGTNSSNYLLDPVHTDHTIAANFIQQFRLTPSVTTGDPTGSIAPATAQGVDLGQSLAFTITPATGYRIGSVLTDNVAQVVPAAATSFQVPFNAVADNHKLTASFIKVWKVDTSVSRNGSVDKPGTQVVDDGTTPSYTFTPSSPKFQVGKIIVDSVAQTFTKPATISGAVTFALPAVGADKAVSAVFVPSGDLDANGKVEVADALKALKIFVNIQTPDSTDPEAMKIGPLDAAGVPSGGSTPPDLNDIILILKKAVGAVSW